MYDVLHVIYLWSSYFDILYILQLTPYSLASLAQSREHLLQSWEVLGLNPGQVQWVARSL